MRDATGLLYIQAFQEDPLMPYLYKGLPADRYSEAVAADSQIFTTSLFARPGTANGISWCAVDASNDQVVEAAVVTPSKNKSSISGLPTQAEVFSAEGLPWWSLVGTSENSVRMITSCIASRIAVTTN